MTTVMTLATLTSNLQTSLDNIKTDAHSLNVEDYRTMWDFTDSTTDIQAKECGALMTELVAYSSVNKAIKDRLPVIASQLLHDDVWKTLKNCKSVNKAIELVLGSGAKSTISGAVAVARMFYNCTGNMVEPNIYGKSNYQCLQRVAQSTEKHYHESLCKWFRENPNCTVKELTDHIKELEHPPVDVESSEVEESAQAETKESAQAETKESVQAETKETVQADSKKSSNAHYQLTQLRAHIDTMTKEQIKKALDDIIALG